MAKHLFKKGEVTNPNGRPKGSVSFKTKVEQSFKEALETPIDKKGTTAMEAFLTTFMNAALNDPKSQAHKFMAERLFDENILENIDEALNRAKSRDEDFLQFRILKRGFDEQQKRILSSKKVKLNPAGRRSGKTESNVLEASYIVQKPDKKVLIIGLTMETVVKMYWDKFIKLFEDLGIETASTSKTEHFIKLSNGSEIHFRGNSNADEREKMRGFFYDAIIIDEAQSQKSLKSLVEDICEPMLLDRQGTLIITGSGPRIRGTYWQFLWDNAKTEDTFKIQWNLTFNPFIPNKENVFKEILEKKGLTENSPLFKREYLGDMDAYDDDALVFRLTDKNFYTEQELMDWMNKQPYTDLHLTAGLDYGWTDPTAFCIIVYSDSSPEKWILYEFMQSNMPVNELVDKIREGLDKTSMQSTIDFRFIWADHNEQRTTVMLQDTYGLPMMNAMKTDKKMAIDILRDEIRLGYLKVPKDGIFHDESLHTIYKRDEQDNLTKEIDDDAFHPNMMDAIIYSLREYWNYAQVKYTDNEDDNPYTSFRIGESL